MLWCPSPSTICMAFDPLDSLVSTTSVEEQLPIAGKINGSGQNASKGLLSQLYNCKPFHYCSFLLLRAALMLVNNKM